jgi:hypothetical protein
MPPRIASAPIDHKKKKRSSHTGRVRPPGQEVGLVDAWARERLR